VASGIAERTCSSQQCSALLLEFASHASMCSGRRTPIRRKLRNGDRGTACHARGRVVTAAMGVRTHV
jgi:hypothetical protein